MAAAQGAAVPLRAMAGALMRGPALAPCPLGPTMLPVAAGARSAGAASDLPRAAGTRSAQALAGAGAGLAAVLAARRRSARLPQRLVVRGPTTVASAGHGACASAPATARRAVATATAPPTTASGVFAASAKPGDRRHGWTCERVEELAELKCSGVLWKHDKTGAELLSVEQPLEENKTFGVVFRTPPEDSSGIAHVLEHSVLCGSRKYPVKEPFVELLKGSVQTFLNAMTYPDRTCYPVASCNLQDFYNLIDVYLDAVLHPRALKDPLVLAQEGWHYEVEEKEKPLTFKGVVYNEMKGVYSSPESVQGRKLLNSLLPDTPYGVDSGGDPKEIPNLTFDYFKGFHQRFYHPSNAKFWFYGDDPADRRLELLDAFLSDFERNKVNSDIPTQPLWKEPRKVEHDFAVGADEDISKKAMACVSWLLSDAKPDLETSFALSILDYVIMGTPASPLRKALTDSGLGSRVIGGGLYDGLVQPTFSVGLKDIKEADAEVVEKLILDTLEHIAKEGLELEAIEAALNRIEFMNRELNTGGLPRGLALMFSAVSNWNYGKDPFEALRFDSPLKALREKLIDRKEPLLENMIRERLLRNTHRLSVVSKPSFEEGPRRDAEEEERLRSHKATLSEQEIERLIAETKTLKKIQETPDSPEALAKVPRLQLSDIPKESPKIPTEVGAVGSATVLRHPLLTSGVVYVDVAFDLRAVPAELVPLLPLFCRGLKEMGTSKCDFVQLQRRTDLATGGISASPMVSSKRGSEEPVTYLVLRGKAMEAKMDALLDLMAEMATEVNWANKERFLQLAREAHAGGRSQLLSSGHVVAASRIGRNLSLTGWLSEQMSGLSQYECLGGLLSKVEKNWEGLEAQLSDLQARIFQQACVVNLTADPDVLARLDAPLEAFLKRMPAKRSAASAVWSPVLAPENEGIVVPSQVNYVAKGSNLYKDAGYKLHGSAVVASRLLGTTYLWDRVRVSGGAYGCFSRFDPRSGNFLYMSYRDPNLTNTLETYDGTAEFLRNMHLGEDELAKSILGTMGDIDSHQLPDAKGYTALQRHLLAEPDELRQEMRDQVLGTTKEDIVRFADAVAAVRGGAVCVVGGDAAVRAAAAPLGLALRSPFAAAEAPAGSPAGA